MNLPGISLAVRWPDGGSLTAIDLLTLGGALLVATACLWRRMFRRSAAGGETAIRRQELLDRRADRLAAAPAPLQESDLLGPAPRPRCQDPRDAPPEETLPLAGNTVLIADDDFNLTQALAYRCERLGLTVIRSPDALHALFGAHKLEPDVVILDVTMPNGSGLAVCEMLRSDPTRPHTPVIIYTGDSQRETVERCQILGAHYVLKAPDSWHTIERLLYRLLGAQDAGPASGDSEPRLPVPLPVPTSAPPPETPSSVPRATKTRADEPGALAPFEETREDPTADRRDGTSESDNSHDPGASTEDRSLPRRPRILVIDDDPDILRAITMRLQSFGADVLRAFSGMQGYWTAVDARPDVILCDMRMPEGEGNYIFGRILDHPLTRNIPVIIITGQDNLGLKREMLSMGAAAYLPKPIVMKDLLDELRRHVTLPLHPVALSGTEPAALTASVGVPTP